MRTALLRAVLSGAGYSTEPQYTSSRHGPGKGAEQPGPFPAVDLRVAGLIRGIFGFSFICPGQW